MRYYGQHSDQNDTRQQPDAAVTFNAHDEFTQIKTRWLNKKNKAKTVDDVGDVKNKSAQWQKLT